jgi:mannose-6-phosphate isomerase-like protein (cupin superfamily)
MAGDRSREGAGAIRGVVGAGDATHVSQAGPEENAMLTALYVTQDAIVEDPALQPGCRGDRKILVTEIRAKGEMPAKHVRWKPPGCGGDCEVQKMFGTEVAHFTHEAAQDRHHHKKGTEIYMVLAGSMLVEVEGDEYALRPGDMLVVNPGAWHRVKRDGPPFLARVVTVNCGGASDKYKQDTR